MAHSEVSHHEDYPDTHHDTYSKTVFGFWVYLLTDFILFGSLFAVYAVLKNHTFGGPSAQDLFVLQFTLVQSLLMLICSFTSGLAGAYAHRRNKNMTLLYFFITFVLGLGFMAMELHEFRSIMSAGYTWKGSAFLSAYFTLVGTYGIHMIFALSWIPILLFPVLKEGITSTSLRRLTCLRMFWQFLNIIWVFIFTSVYLLGVN